MALSIDKILGISPNQYFKGVGKVGEYNAEPMTYPIRKVSEARAKKYFARKVPSNAEVVLDFKCLRDYNSHMIVFGVALIPKRK